MQLRSFIFAGLWAAFTFGAPAYAAMPAATAHKAAAKSDVVDIAARSPSAELKMLKRKKKPTAAEVDRIEELEARIAADRKAARVKAVEAKKLALREAAKARAEAARQAFLAGKNKKDRFADARPADRKPVKMAEPLPAAEPVPAEAMNVALTGNNGELRSASVEQKQSGGLFSGLFGGTSSSMALLPETRALDAVLEKKQARKQFTVKPEFEPQEVQFTGYSAGTIVIDTGARRLYLVESPFTARRYAIAVGRDGLQFKGTVKVGDKQEWPRWIPTLDMQKREPEHYAQYKDGMAGGPDNPLGARAIYLYDGKKDTHLRIHGTNQPQTVGTSASNGCFHMINDHVMDLYRRVDMGAKVVIL